jgi:hypothetical protein
MEQIEQLKAMRDAAQARIAATPDYRLMTSLNTLIGELETAYRAATAVPAREPAQTGATGHDRASVAAPAVQARIAAEEEALDRAVADLEAELVAGADRTAAMRS